MSKYTHFTKLKHLREYVIVVAWGERDLVWTTGFSMDT
jgi:hypothetical protein